ncbi:odorant receptor 67a-like [Odontomachus brunneus]|uniref:odorant receptor 67a-like n=1 Tax=Odontomachus brunneus TaxID=486640 RepID=UPI0013F1D2D6|nr:odorant receptor 67a-like [Odontomachus brunneus]
MSIFIKNDKLLRALRVCGILTRVWPLEDGVSRLLVIFYKALLLINLVNDFCLIPALIKGIMYYRNDFGNMMKAIVELMYVLEMISTIVYCVAQEKRLRMLLDELECADGKRSSPYEEILRQKYRFYLRIIYSGMITSYFVCGGSYILAPLILSQRKLRNFPLNAIFPLPMSETWAWYLVYVQNACTIVQASKVVQVDVMIFTVLWNATFKFRMLGMKMHSMFSVAELRAAIDAHQNALDYAQESGSVASFLIIKSTTIAFINTITSSLLILRNVPMWELIQFVSIILLSLLRLYIICWVAEVMTDMAYEISWRIYDSPWIYATSSVRRTVCMIIQRCQKSVNVKVTSVIPAICVNFFGNVVSAGFSYFVTLRTILGDRI